MKHIRFRILRKKIKGFTMAELMVVMAIMGILVLLALPKFMSVITMAKTKEAELQLKHLLQLEKLYFYVHSKYSSNLTEIGFEQQKLVSEDGTANYKIEVVEAGNNSFKARATSITDFDGDGTLDVWEVDQNDKLKEVTPD